MCRISQPQKVLNTYQLKRLQWTVAHAYKGSPVYRAKLQKTGVAAEDLRKGYPFPLVSVPFDKVVRIHLSSGTTGKRKNLCYTQKDVDDWIHCFRIKGRTNDMFKFRVVNIYPLLRFC